MGRALAWVAPVFGRAPICQGLSPAGLSGHGLGKSHSGHAEVMNIEGNGNVTKLTVTHEIDKSGSKFIEAVSGGWPKVLSNLKSLLETGEVLTADKACLGQARSEVKRAASR